ncbi:hypothetical protein M422DRAFT_252995 [Sphaerobolus stellatus SS14]|uniref:Uncharacterized protein n=1 Tax=Sphaerobolus stellatus (strain SS14) TaxID=990650 RepID=A0A0C9UL03_SPHS4|nr:hypothetical protein M422DRAFT_252995 [Sphaerobolus stellatus SS14]
MYVHVLSRHLALDAAVVLSMPLKVHPRLLKDEDAKPRPAKVAKETLKPDKGKGRVDLPAASSSKASYVVADSARPAPVTAVPTGPFLHGGSAANPLLQQLACQLDPAETAAREDAHALCQYQAGEINNLHMQLNQQQTDNQRLWDEVLAWQHHFDQAERCCDQLQTQLHMMMMNTMIGGHQPEMPQIRGSAFDFRSDRSSASSSSGMSSSSRFGGSVFNFRSDVPMASSSSSGALSNPPTSLMDAHITPRRWNELQYD